ncbi:kinase [Nocardia sp. BSTN01]|uniref:GHMP family kinase ATP-binding protein n=1 Tax=Nocardia sp. BSTN01 TaxID=2783665 RepID=UPI00188E3391|nr:kinase [Nocardia sp. BSTN01]MBF5001843.1 kinase [Nocardia sp. BSTN01]
MTAVLRVGVGSAFGSCGELLQGVTACDSRDFLVTLPITRGAVAVFEPDPHRDTLTVIPGRKTKSATLARALLARSPAVRGGVLTLLGDLPEGKGLASSTADLVATARAVADAEGREITAAEIETELRCIEPSDGVMHPGAVAFCHREVRLLALLGALPPLTIVTADEGGQIDTVAFNRHRPTFTTAAKREYSALLAELATAVAAGDVAAIGAVATRSAEMSTILRSRPHLDTTIAAARDLGAAGVVVAHSGTTTGILLDETDPQLDAKIAAAQRVCTGFAESITVHRTWRPYPPDCSVAPDFVTARAAVEVVSR